jgi:hypothetical protein
MAKLEAQANTILNRMGVSREQLKDSSVVESVLAAVDAAKGMDFKTGTKARIRTFAAEARQGAMAVAA